MNSYHTFLISNTTSKKKLVKTPMIFIIEFEERLQEGEKWPRIGVVVTNSRVEENMLSG